MTGSNAFFFLTLSAALVSGIRHSAENDALAQSQCAGFYRGGAQPVGEGWMYAVRTEYDKLYKCDDVCTKYVKKTDDVQTVGKTWVCLGGLYIYNMIKVSAHYAIGGKTLFRNCNSAHTNYCCCFAKW